MGKQHQHQSASPTRRTLDFSPYRYLQDLSESPRSKMRPRDIALGLVDVLVPMHNRFVDVSDGHGGVGKRSFGEFSRVQADGVVKFEYQSRESPTTRDPAAAAVPVKPISGHGVVALPSKHRRKFAAPKR